MNKLVPVSIMVFALVVVVSTSGCIQTPTTSNLTNVTQIVNLTTPTGNASQAPVEVGVINITATAASAPSEAGLFAPRQGSQFVYYNVTLTNINATDRPASPLFFTARDSANTSYSVDLKTFDPTIHGFPAATLTRPGDVVNGTIVFQVPQNTTLTTLIYNDHLSEETIPL